MAKEINMEENRSFSIKELIDQYYLDIQKERRQKKFWISDIERCARSIFFKFKDIPLEKLEKISPAKQRLFDQGNQIQAMLLNPLFSQGLVRATEVRIPPQEFISGKADAILSIDGRPYVLEIKSISGRKDLEKMDEPIREHFLQTQLYLHYFKIPQGILLYMNKDTQELKEFFLNYDPQQVQHCLLWFDKLKAQLDANIVPLRLADFPQNWQCEDCPFRKICELAGAERVNWDELNRKLNLINEAK